MAKKQINIVVDTMQNSYSTIGTFKEFDSVFFNATILENGIPKDLTGQTLKLYVKRADRTILEQTTDIKIIEATKGTITIDVKSGAFKGEGFSVFELNISDTTGSITTANFTSRTVKKLANDEIIENSNEIDLLKEVEIYVNLAKKEIQDFKKLQGEMTTLNTSMKQNEETRKTNETARVEAEKLRERKFEEMEGSSQLLEMTQEVEKARNGKTTLHEEMTDLENRMVENIAKQYLEVSTETGHMKVENCFNGKTKDLAIKGSTLHNLISEYYFGDGINEGNGFVKCVAGSGWKATRMQSLAINLLKPSTQYTVVTEITKNTLNGLFYVNVGEGHAVRAFKTVNPVTVGQTGIISTLITSTDDFTGVVYGVYPAISDKSTEGEIIFRQYLLEGDWTNKEVPTYFEGIKSLGEEENKIRILTCGKNLLKPLDESMFDFSPIQLDNYSFVAGGRQAIKCNIEVETNTDYVFSCKAKPLVGSSEMLVRWFENGTLKGTMVNNKMNINSQSCNIQLAFYVGAPFDISQVQYSELMIQKCKDTNDLNFQVYKEDKRDILFPVQFGCKSLPSGVADESYDNGDYLQKVEKYTITGDETITGFNANFQFIEFKPNPTYGFTANTDLICSKYPTAFTANKDYKWVSATSHGAIRLRLLDVESATREEVILELKKQAPFDVYYPLAEPILHKAETPTNNNPTTFKDVTHISCLNKIAPSNMTAKFPVDVAATFSRLNRENKDLINENIFLINKANSLTIENELQQLDIDTNMLATIDLFEMMLGATKSIKGGEGMVEVYVSMIIKGKKKLEDVPAIIRSQVEQMLRDLGVIA